MIHRIIAPKTTIMINFMHAYSKKGDKELRIMIMGAG